MTYVINPWFFYLIGVVDNLIGVLITVAIISGSCSVGYMIAKLGLEGFKKSVAVALAAVSALCILVSVLLPTSETITKMMIAQNVTYERVEVVVDTVERVYEDIMKLFDKQEVS